MLFERFDRRCDPEFLDAPVEEFRIGLRPHPNAVDVAVKCQLEQQTRKNHSPSADGWQGMQGARGYPREYQGKQPSTACQSGALITLVQM